MSERSQEARRITLSELREELAEIEDQRERVLTAIRALTEAEDLPDHTRGDG